MAPSDNEFDTPEMDYRLSGVEWATGSEWGQGWGMLPEGGNTVS